MKLETSSCWIVTVHVKNFTQDVNTSEETSVHSCLFAVNRAATQDHEVKVALMLVTGRNCDARMSQESYKCVWTMTNNLKFKTNSKLSLTVKT